MYTYDTETGKSADPMAAYIKDADRDTRMGFIRKVYTLLSIQLVITFGLVILTLYVPAIQKFFYEYSYFILIFSVVFMIVASCTLICCYPLLQKTPWNYIFLFIYTIVIACLLASVCGMIEPKIVLAAMAITFVLVLVVSIWACFTKTDFTPYSLMLYCSLLALVFSGLFMFWWSNFMYSVYCAIAVIIFTCYLIYDTQMIVGGDHKFQFSVDDYVLAALNLYLDIINIFLYILSLLSNNSN